MNEPSTMCEAFHRTVAQRPDAIALRGTTSHTWADYAARAAAIAGGLAAAGVEKGDTVALLLSNRPEFHFADTAVQHLRAVPFSCYNTSSPEQLRFLMGASGARVAITEQRLAPALRGSVNTILLVDDLPAWERPGFDLASAATTVRPDDLLTLVYTSGTTGRPKGVEITHANMVAMVAATAPMFGVRAGDRLVSFLPAAHIADRLNSHYLHLWAGTEVTCLPDIRDLAAALVEVRPTLFGAVPEVWQRIVTSIRNLSDPTQRAAVAQAVEIGLRHQHTRAAGDELAMLHRAAEHRVLAPLRAKLGLDQVRVAVTAAAPTPPEVVEFINAIGVPLIEAWGMSELSGVGTMVPPGTVRSGTIGLPIPAVEARLLDDGELLVRGPTVTRGYKDQPDETAAAIDPDGWLHTGDIATRDEDGYLHLIDRKKDLLITTGGKNIAPAAVELALKTHCPLIGQAVVVGDARPHLTALIVLDPEMVRGMDDETIAASIGKGVEAANATLSRPEQVRAFDVLTEPWPPGGDLVTPTMKVRRRAVLARYADRIEALYR
ncbi:long-chain fatty acid--CoA ligase [Actinoplanes sp. TBRC 11911]|uniref:AMP-dependent synthetase/ligase n=1 Tax=Actinoplanes sp. TBRC 11911 TaxID=2729386 RepID=UPI00145C444A|nr:AMP-dependent synthetase/ligase [Actinoplanes sp. TBRC 11911]NMO55290.1 long-chain fatty acid--CoA ligase [Actinoplanes sp. TBRC 11911]